MLRVLLAVFVSYLVVGLAMPVLPVHVHDKLGFGSLAVGMVAGSQFAASLVSRFWSGHFADTRGCRLAVLIGLGLAVSSGIFYGLSLLFAPASGLVVLLLGRALLGAAESFVVTGGLSWALSLSPEGQAGQAISRVGMALWAAFAIGAPLGTTLYHLGGFAAIAAATALIPLTAGLLLLGLPATPRAAPFQAGLTSLIRQIWKPGIGLAFGSIGFGAITAFLPLLYSQQGWAAAWLALSALSLAFISARLLLGHLPDRLGGGRVAFWSLLVESAGQFLIWGSYSPELVLLGVVISGFGYALVYPSFGLEALIRVDPDARGLAMGVYSAFPDLALGLACPALGQFGNLAGPRHIFLISACSVLGGVLFALNLKKR